MRHTVSRNFKMLDDTRDQNLLIPTRHYVVPKSIGKRQTKEDKNGLSGCNNVYINHLYIHNKGSIRETHCFA